MLTKGLLVSSWADSKSVQVSALCCASPPMNCSSLSVLSTTVLRPLSSPAVGRTAASIPHTLLVVNHLMLAVLNQDYYYTEIQTGTMRHMGWQWVIPKTKLGYKSEAGFVLFHAEAGTLRSSLLPSTICVLSKNIFKSNVFVWGWGQGRSDHRMQRACKVRRRFCGSPSSPLHGFQGLNTCL